MKRLLAALALCAACTDGSSSGRGVEGTTHVETYVLPAAAAPKLDLLFVVDDRTAMAPHQQPLAAVPAQLEALLASEYGDAGSYHVGVITTDAASGGELRRSSAVADAFIVYDNAFSGTTTNYQGSLASALASLMPSSAASTAPNQPLESTRRALGNAANAGFLRAEAFFGLVTITASDDASPGTPAEYAAALKATNAEPTNVYAVGVVPAAAPRLTEHLAQLPNRSEVHSIEDTDYAAALAAFAKLYRRTLGYACNRAPLDFDPVAEGGQYDCSFVWIDNGTERRLPACTASIGEPCWELVMADPQICVDPAARVHLQTRGFTTSASPFGDPYHPEIRGQCIVE
jgi:hypothetical protein